MNFEKRQKGVALALSCGGARGLAHIGVIEELLSRGYEITSVAGTSMGALVGGIFAAGKLSEEDKLTVSRARKIQRFLSQPFTVAEQFTGMEGKYVPIQETIRGFREIIEGKHDDLPESAFLFVGTIDEAVAKAKKGEQA